MSGKEGAKVELKLQNSLIVHWRSRWISNSQMPSLIPQCRAISPFTPQQKTGEHFWTEEQQKVEEARWNRGREGYVKVYTLNVHPTPPPPPVLFPHSAFRKLEAMPSFSSLETRKSPLWGNWQPSRNYVKIVMSSIPHKITQADLPTLKRSHKFSHKKTSRIPKHLHKASNTKNGDQNQHITHWLKENRNYVGMWKWYTNRRTTPERKRDFELRMPNRMLWERTQRKLLSS